MKKMNVCGLRGLIAATLLVGVCSPAFAGHNSHDNTDVIVGTIVGIGVAAIIADAVSDSRRGRVVVYDEPRYRESGRDSYRDRGYSRESRHHRHHHRHHRQEHWR